MRNAKCSRTYYFVVPGYICCITYKDFKTCFAYIYNKESSCYTKKRLITNYHNHVCPWKSLDQWRSEGTGASVPGRRAVSVEVA